MRISDWSSDVRSSDLRRDRCQPGRTDGAAARRRQGAGVTITKSLLLFALAAVAEIGGAWLVWQGVREHRGWVWIGAGVLALGAYGFVATLQPDANFGRILAAYGGVFVAGDRKSTRLNSSH